MPSRRSRWRGGLLGSLFAIVTASTFSASEARADWDFQFATNMNAGWLRQLPPFSAERLSTSARDFKSGQQISQSGGMALLGVAADLEVTLDDRWRVPLVGGALYWGVGSYDAKLTSFDGSIARLRPWTTIRGDILLPGIGRRWKHRRNQWGVAARSGISIASMEGTVAAGREIEPLKLSATTLLVVLEVEGCRRLDPTTRVCVQIAPRIFEHELMNGLTVGLRLEWGR